MEEETALPSWAPQWCLSPHGCSPHTTPSRAAPPGPPPPGSSVRRSAAQLSASKFPTANASCVPRSPSRTTVETGTRGTEVGAEGGRWERKGLDGVGRGVGRLKYEEAVFFSVQVAWNCGLPTTQKSFETRRVH